MSAKEEVVKETVLLEEEMLPGEDYEILLADERYQYLGIITKSVLKKAEGKIDFSDMLDKVLLDKHLGLPVFLAIMWGIFQITFFVSAPLMDLIDAGFLMLAEAVSPLITNEILASFLVDGVIGGLGFVLTFVPPIFILFLLISILEDTGYLARAAFVMDRIMYKLGLSGKSFIPMLLGFGCNVPAVMATRGIEDEKDRMITILVNPLMSCSARLPVYILLAGAFFGALAGTAIFSMYILGIGLAIMMALIFRKTLFKGKPAPLILELPTYKMPTLVGTASNMWNRGSMFIKKAGTIIFAAMIVLWALMSIPWGVPIDQTLVGGLGHILAPIVAPLGLSWMAGIVLFFGFIAKEVVVGTYALLLGVEGGALGVALTGIMTPISALAIMVITLIYMPCVATIGVIKKETGSWKWTIFTVVYGLILAYAVAAAVVGIGTLIGVA